MQNSQFTITQYKNLYFIIRQCIISIHYNPKQKSQVTIIQCNISIYYYPMQRSQFLIPTAIYLSSAQQISIYYYPVQNSQLAII